jgi:hypothetical protein
MLQVDPIQSYLSLKIGLPPVLKAGSSGSQGKMVIKILNANGYFKLFNRVN